MKKRKIAIFASGNGSNAENIIQFFQNRDDVSIDLVLSNNPNAFVLKRAEKFEVPTLVFNRLTFYQSQEILEILQNRQIDLIVLAGFMWLVPEYLISNYSQRIINIHPALLPNYGGKGMYGDFVHQAVSEAGETETGITIHLVNEHYDEGAVIFQKEVVIEAGENPETIAHKVHNLEYEFFPIVIERVLNELS